VTIRKAFLSQSVYWVTDAGQIVEADEIIRQAGLAHAESGENVYFDEHLIPQVIALLRLHGYEATLQAKRLLPQDGAQRSE